MPYYYNISRTPGTPGTLLTASGTPNTLATHFRLATVANQMMARIMAMFANGRFSTAGGGLLMLIRPGTIGSGGTANTPAPKAGTNQPVAATTAFDDATTITPGATPVVQQTVGFAQTGGQAGWVALEIDDSVKMGPNAGANGQLEVASKCAAASVTFDASLDLQEN